MNGSRGIVAVARIVARVEPCSPGRSRPPDHPGGRPTTTDLEATVPAVTVDDVLDHLLPDDWRESGMETAADPGMDAEEERVRGGSEH